MFVYKYLIKMIVSIII